ncbi:MAG: hypothetical protein M3457_17505 [Chloroflexota bacterium]|nr:hypothetical protein [Chloroflexota bacterium]
MNLPLLAGTISTVLFMFSTFPMLHKAFRSKDLRSYSLGNMLLANSGNAVHSLYVYSLPPGPIWWLHSFHLITTGLMLAWYLRYEWRSPFVPRLRSRIGSLGDSIPNAAKLSRHAD